MKTFDQTTNRLYVLRISNLLIDLLNEANFDRQKGNC